MPNLLERLVAGNGEHRLAQASLLIYGETTIRDISVKEYSSDLMIQVVEDRGRPFWDSAELDIQDTAENDYFLPTKTNNASILVVGSDTYTPSRLSPNYVDGDLSRLNQELGLQSDYDDMEIQWDSLVGSMEEQSNGLKLSANISLIIEQSGDSGGLDPDDPEPEDPEPVDPEDPDIIVIGGGINEVTLQINPNSYYTLGIGLADGVSLNGVTGLDNSMKWDGYKQTLSGWVLGSTPKEVTVMLGTDTAKLSVAAIPISRHVI